MKGVLVFFNIIKAWCFVLLLFLSGQTFAQGLLNNGGYIVITSGTYIYVAGGASTGDFTNQDAGGSTGTVVNSGTMDVTGDWTNSSAGNVFNANTGTVEFVGSNYQNIYGPTTTWFNNVNLLGTFNTFLHVYTIMGGGYVALSPNGSLNLNSQHIILNSNTLEMTDPSAISITRTTGYIESETHLATNPSVIKWDSTITGSYVFPFGDTLTGNYLPLTLTKNGGSATTSIYASTRATAANDNLPWQSTVTNMYSLTVGGNGAIPVVIDRWWDISSPTNFVANASFTYGGVENTTTYAPTGTFAAQNWSGAIWFPPVGSGPGVLAGTAVVSIPAQGMGGFIATPWILSNITAPLPVELLSFNAELNKGVVDVTWSTASEINSDYFMVEKSADGNNFVNVGRKDAAGTSTWLINYNLVDPSPYSGLSYYRLKQVDMNGDFKYSSTVAVYISEQNLFNFVYASVNNAGDMTMMFADNTIEPCMITVYDMLGKELYKENITTVAGVNMHEINMENFSHGIYYISISNNETSQTKKIVY